MRPCWEVWLHESKKAQVFSSFLGSHLCVLISIWDAFLSASELLVQFSHFMRPWMRRFKNKGKLIKSLFGLWSSDSRLEWSYSGGQIYSAPRGRWYPSDSVETEQEAAASQSITLAEASHRHSSQQPLQPALQTISFISFSDGGLKKKRKTHFKMIHYF